MPTAAEASRSLRNTATTRVRWSQATTSSRRGSGEARAEQKLKVEPGEVHTPVFVLDAGTLIVRPRASEGAEISDSATVVVEYPGGTGPATNYGETKIILPAGEQKLDRQDRHG